MLGDREAAFLRELIRQKVDFMALRVLRDALAVIAAREKEAEK